MPVDVEEPEQHPTNQGRSAFHSSTFEQWVDVLPSATEHSKREDGSILKRVSLDATETWLGDDEDDDEIIDEQDLDDTMMILGSWPEPGSDAPALPNLMALDEVYLSGDGCSMMLSEGLLEEAVLSPLRGTWSPHPCNNDALDASDRVERPMLLRNSSSSSDAVSGKQLTLVELFEKRRAQLTASMQASQLSRKCLEQHIQQRANLASVLADIERSSRQVVEILSNDASMDQDQTEQIE